MKKTIYLTNEWPWDRRIGITNLKLIWKNRWQWDGMLVFWKKKVIYDDRVPNSYYDDPMKFRKGFKYHTLNKEWLKSYIWVFENLIFNKPENLYDYSDLILWNNSDIHLKIEWCFSKKVNNYSLYFSVQNKYRSKWSVENIEFYEWGFYDPDRHWTDESYWWNDAHFWEENLKKYIEELIEEYERETWEKYQRLETEDKWFFWKIFSE